MASLRKLSRSFFRALRAWQRDQRLAARIEHRITQKSFDKMHRIELAYRAERVRRGLDDVSPYTVAERRSRKAKVHRG